MGGGDNRQMKRYFLVLLLVQANLCFSQSRPRVQHLNVEDGLSQSSVYSILQDSYGFIWLATGDGLNRYDGKEFQSYKSRLTNSQNRNLKDRNLNSLIFEDCYHNFWFSADEGVYCMDRRTNNFTVCINKKEAGYSSCVVGIDSDKVWTLITGKGVYKIEAGNKQIRSYPFTDSFQTHSGVSPLITNGINTPDGIWIADLRGLIWFDKHTNRDKRILVKDDIKKVYKLKDERLLLATFKGVILYNPADKSERFIPLSLPGRKTITCNSIVQDTVSGFVYVSERDGGELWKLDLTNGKHELIKLQENTIVRLYIDKSQNLWVGTDGGGVYKLDIKPPKFHCYFPRSGSESGAMVKSLYSDDSGKIWIGLYSRGVVTYDPKTGIEKTIEAISKTEAMQVNCIFKDSDGDIVVAVDNKVIWVDEQSGKKKKECLLPHLPYMGNVLAAIYYVTELHPGYFLVGTNHGILTIRKNHAQDGAKLSKAFFTNQFNGWIYSLVNEGQNDVYIGRRNGFSIARMQNDSTPTLLEQGLPDLPIRHFYKSTTTPVLWLASEQGLIAFNELTKKYTVYDERVGMANSFVYAILPQNDSTLWLSTNKGLSMVTVHYGNCEKITASFKNYTAKDGLQSNEFNSGAYFKCKDGTLIFGGIAGINWFDPTAVLPNVYLATPAITEIFVDDTLTESDAAVYLNKLTLPYNRNTVSLTFKALEFTLPEQNRFAYRLIGQDANWVYTSNDKVRYSQLSPGEYTFELKASNNEGIWNEKPLSLKITITPPYWQTWWFRTLMLLVAGSAAGGVARYYIHLKVVSKTRELEKQHALNLERIRISKDVHDDIGSGLSKISLLCELAKRKITENQSPGKDVGHISAISKELVDNMRDLIWVLNPENTTLDNLLSRMREYCADYLDGVNVESKFCFPDHVPEMNISRDVQRNIFSTVKEALNNSVKHANAHLIGITVEITDRLLSIDILDDGSGFVISDARSGGNGLRNMKNRIESVGGVFKMKSNTQKGTLISISIAFDKLVETT
jgi:signal transduction histidine kinase/ligand-binding sensor domain-containing protein